MVHVHATFIVLGVVANSSRMVVERGSPLLSIVEDLLEVRRNTKGLPPSDHFHHYYNTSPGSAALFKMLRLV